EHRLGGVKAALSTLDSDKFKIRDDELLKSGVSYTYDTILDFTKKYPEDAFYLIVGVDQLENFDKWKEFKKLLKISKLVVTSRPGLELPQTKKELPAALASLVKTFRHDRAILKGGGEIIFVKLNDVDVSATEIRRKLRRDESVNHLTPGAVVDYLVANNVYDKSELLVKDYAAFTKYCAKILNQTGGLSVTAYDVREMTQPSEFTLTASGTSTRHTKALCEHVVKEAKEKFGIHPQSTEGMQEGRWVVIDYGSLMIHLFYDFVRNEYRIEDLWAGAPKLSI
ncbi:MAG: ribosome silencing factor, partial [Bdellovibrionales bacterium]|nr:ribosome silencing factor [Bdellovibrionales bacterium]